MLRSPMPRMDTFVSPRAVAHERATPGSAAACSAGVTTARGELLGRAHARRQARAAA